MSASYQKRHSLSREIKLKIRPENRSVINPEGCIPPRTLVRVTQDVKQYKGCEGRVLECKEYPGGLRMYKVKLVRYKFVLLFETEELEILK